MPQDTQSIQVTPEPAEGEGTMPPPHPPDSFGTRLMIFGLLTTQDLQWIFAVSDDTIARAVKRGQLPPPVFLCGRNMWTIESIQQHLAKRLEEARLQAEREQAQKDTKVQALYDGGHHGRHK